MYKENHDYNINKLSRRKIPLLHDIILPSSKNSIDVVTTGPRGCNADGINQ